MWTRCDKLFRGMSPTLGWPAYQIRPCEPTIHSPCMPDFDSGQTCATAKGMLHSSHCFLRIASSNRAAFDDSVGTSDQEARIGRHGSLTDNQTCRCCLRQQGAHRLGRIPKAWNQLTYEAEAVGKLDASEKNPAIAAARGPLVSPPSTARSCPQSQRMLGPAGWRGR